MSHVPSGYVVEHYAPEEFHAKCPDCGRERTFQSRPGKGARRCGACNRLMGVTPLAEISDPDADDADAEEFGDVFVCSICGDSFETANALGGHKSSHAVADGGQPMGLLLANDCENPDRMGAPSARSTGLPECSGYDTERGPDGQLERATVTISVVTHRGNSCTRYFVRYDVRDGTAVPSRVDSQSSHVDSPAGVRRVLTLLLAAQTAIIRLDDIEEVLSVREALADIEASEPENGYEPVGASTDEVEQAVAEVSD